MATRDLTALFQDGALEYPGVPSRKHPRGKTYRVPSPDGRTGLYLNQLADMGITDSLTPVGMTRATDKLRLDDDEEREFWPLVLGCTDECGAEVATPGANDGDEPVVTKNPPCGSAFDQMMDDGVAWTHIQTIGQDAFLVFGVNEGFADAMQAINGGQSADGDEGSAEGKAPAPANRAQRRAAAKRAPAKKVSSAGKGGSSSSRASGAANTPTSPARTRGSAAPAKKTPAKQAS